MALNGIEKASLLLMALGSSASAQVFKHLSEDEIEKLSAEIVRMREVDPSLMQSVVQEFERMSPVQGGGIPEVDLTQGARTNHRPFEALSRTEAGRIAQLLLEEQPQVTALVLASLPRNKAASVLAEFDEDTQSQIALCICQMEEVDPEVIAAIEQSLQTKLATTTHRTSQRTGAQALIEILNNASHDTGRAVLGALQKKAPTFAEQVRGRMFTFDDLPRLDDTAIQYVLREVDNDDLIVALKASDEHIRELVLRNMSQHAAEALKESLEIPKPVKVRDIEASQQRVAGVARHLLAMGIIAMSEMEEERIA
jgi:flagellar motor switch protein FliG